MKPGTIVEKLVGKQNSWKNIKMICKKGKGERRKGNYTKKKYTTRSCYCHVGIQMLYC